MLPSNFCSSQVNSLVDLHSHKALLMVLDLVVVAMLNSDRCEDFVQRIMSLSESAQADIQKLIIRSKSSLDDLLSSSFN